MKLRVSLTAYLTTYGGDEMLAVGAQAPVHSLPN